MAVPAALEAAASVMGVDPGGLRVTVVGAAARDGAQMTELLRSLGVHAVDSGVNDRRAALASAPLPPADIFYLVGGNPAMAYDALLGTPVLNALVEHAERGGVVMGHSAGAIVWGAETLSDFASEDDREPFPMFNWIADTVVVPHFQPHDETNDSLEVARGRFPKARILGVAHGGAVMYDGRRRSFQALCDGECSTPSVLVSRSSSARGMRELPVGEAVPLA